VKSLSIIDSSTIKIFRDEFLEAIEWYEKLPNKDKYTIFTDDRYGILRDLKLLVQQGQSVKERYDSHLAMIAEEYRDYLVKELDSYSFSHSYSEKPPSGTMSVETKNKMNKTVQRITDFLNALVAART
jgi:hypothetical protein